MTLPLMTRRAALLAGGAMVLAGSAGGLTISRQYGDRKFVLVILRGALDGLAAVAPYGDPHYRRARGRLALPSPGEVGGVLPLTEGFGLHPNLAFFHEQWKGGELAIIPACASPYRDRSHFDAQDVLETGAAEVFGASEGWLGRALTALPPDFKREAVAISGSLPLVLRGSASATSWAPSFAPSASDDTLGRLMDLYAGDALLGPALASAIETNAIANASGMQGLDGKGRRAGPGAYKGLADAAARLLSAEGGPAAAVLSFEGWDTHANQGAANGQLAQRLAGLDAALRALKEGLGAHWAKTVVAVVTEFGRTVFENGTGGTDHGTGSAAFLLGGAVSGGKFGGDWPGLAPKALFEGRDLAPANDIRSIFMAILQDHWGLAGDLLGRSVFPDATGVRALPGLVRA
ncbi:DUF1501 domain-containing protein [Hyphomonas sp.]|uniref:DUF1501 domain-containing protein n=1 Tax=Hyphomonas sp. TaxID=87 RepID=UPI00391E0066